MFSKLSYHDGEKMGEGVSDKEGDDQEGAEMDFVGAFAFDDGVHN